MKHNWKIIYNQKNIKMLNHVLKKVLNLMTRQNKFYKISTKIKQMKINNLTNQKNKKRNNQKKKKRKKKVGIKNMIQVLKNHSKKMMRNLSKKK